MSTEPEETTTTPKSWTFLALAIVMAAVVSAVIVFFFIFADKRPEIDAWEDATVPFDSDCEDDCISLGTVGQSHGSAPVELLYNPAVDDPIAQWGDCLENIFVCMKPDENIDATPDEKAAIINSCVASSICPVQCNDKFDAISGSSIDRVLQAFDDVFIGPTAWCLPTGEL